MSWPWFLQSQGPLLDENLSWRDSLLEASDKTPASVWDQPPPALVVVDSSPRSWIPVNRQRSIVRRAGHGRFVLPELLKSRTLPLSLTLLVHLWAFPVWARLYPVPWMISRFTLFCSFVSSLSHKDIIIQTQDIHHWEAQHAQSHLVFETAPQQVCMAGADQRPGQRGSLPGVSAPPCHLSWLQVVHHGYVKLSGRKLAKKLCGAQRHNCQQPLASSSWCSTIIGLPSG